MDLLLDIKKELKNFKKLVIHVIFIESSCSHFDKACFQHDSVYADHKDLINRTKSDKVLRDRVYDIASNPE